MTYKNIEYNDEEPSEIESMRTENAALRAEVELLREDKRNLYQSYEQQRRQLAASQLEAKQLRGKFLELPTLSISDQPEWEMSESNPVVWGMFLDRYCEESASSPTSTDALDAYVAEKIKEKVEEHRRATLLRYEQTVEIIQQRDLAIDALEYHQNQTRPIENTMNVLKDIKSQNQTTDKSVDKSLADSDGV